MVRTEVGLVSAIYSNTQLEKSSYKNHRPKVYSLRSHSNGVRLHTCCNRKFQEASVSIIRLMNGKIPCSWQDVITHVLQNNCLSPTSLALEPWLMKILTRTRMVTLGTGSTYSLYDMRKIAHIKFLTRPFLTRKVWNHFPRRTICVTMEKIIQG